MVGCSCLEDPTRGPGEPAAAGTRNLLYRLFPQAKHRARRKPEEIKILMLGPSESGKSTVFKQMRILGQNGYTRDELMQHKKDVRRNLVECMQQMILAMPRLNIKFHTPESICASEAVLSATTDDLTEEFPEPLHSYLDFLWNKSGLKPLYNKLNQISRAICSAPYFFDNMDRIARKDYVPTVQDILNARIKTTTMTEGRFKVGSQRVCLVDVGGQISERSRWVHLFENVTLVIFCVSLEEYDQVLQENPKHSRMLDNFMLFQSVINSHWFRNIPVILLLNKTDVFQRKLAYSPLRDYFEDYRGGPDFESGISYIRDRFRALNKRGTLIYPHYTCATDTKQFEAVLSVIRETLFLKVLEDFGMV